MSVHKRKNRSGKTVWYYQFSLAGSTRQRRNRVFGYGFATKAEAIAAETARRIEEQQKLELAKAGASVTVELPKTLSTLLDEFFRQHVDEKLAPKTVERYREQAAYLAAELLGLPLTEITPLHLTREWKRLLERVGIIGAPKLLVPSRPKLLETLQGLFPALSPKP